MAGELISVAVWTAAMLVTGYRYCVERERARRGGGER